MIKIVLRSDLLVRGGGDGEGGGKGEGGGGRGGIRGEEEVCNIKGNVVGKFVRKVNETKIGFKGKY